ncbi:nucleic acid-binding protein [Pseudomonas cavernae]|uniref:Nucleic acid-binding protein n=1 Tax=Pseudomonas cavernae TaxID=2320867 RepID=A0A385Z447_9PSED|nr:OB-fold domain-containing protein [Pseudomonas cavernae]AYC34069.1 nucleic acid-binding protein [Pseudomonas cavernae]
MAANEQTSAAAPGPEAQYQNFLQQGRFMLQRSQSTGRYVFYPRVLIPGTGETDLEWVDAKGSGTIYAITVNRARTGSHNVALIDLDEGVRMMSRIEGVETAPIGSRVKARIIEVDGVAGVVFDLMGDKA